MEVTKNDLSYDQAKLDYQALLTTARVAYYELLENIYGYYNKLRDTHDTTSYYLNASRLAREANHLVIVGETLATLQGGLERSVIEIVNKPEVKSEVP